MATAIIVSYDGTSNDDDALALGRMLSQTGASIALAYVRHSREFDPKREELAQHDAERRLQQGATVIGDPEIAKHVIVSRSTGEGLAQLAVEEKVSVIVFGSDYRTSPGRAEPGTTAQYLLDGGPVAVAVAAAGLRLQPDRTIKKIATFAADADPVVDETTQALAGKLGAALGERSDEDVDLVIVASRHDGPNAKVSLSGPTRSVLNSSRGSVIVLTHGVPVLL